MYIRFTKNTFYTIEFIIIIKNYRQNGLDPYRNNIADWKFVIWEILNDFC